MDNFKTISASSDPGLTALIPIALFHRIAADPSIWRHQVGLNSPNFSVRVDFALYRRHAPVKNSRHVHQVVRCKSEDGLGFDLSQSDKAGFAQTTNGLAPARNFSHQLALLQTDAEASLAHRAAGHHQRSIALGYASGPRRFHIGHQVIVILYQGMLRITHARLVGRALLVMPGIRISGRLMGLVGAFLAIALGIYRRIATTIFLRWAAAILLHEILHRGTGFNRRAVHREMFVRNQFLPLCDTEYLREKLLRHRFTEQPILICAEAQMISDRFVDIHADKPTVEQVAFNMPDQLPLRTNREQSLQKTGAQQALRCDRWSTTTRVQHFKLRVHALQNRITQGPQLSQQVVLRNPLFQRTIAGHRKLGNVGLAHGIKSKNCSSTSTYTPASLLTGRHDYSTAC